MGSKKTVTNGDKGGGVSKIGIFTATYFLNSPKAINQENHEFKNVANPSRRISKEKKQTDVLNQVFLLLKMCLR